MKPILLIGGSGVVGSALARLLRQTYPGLPLIISGRDAARAAALADELGGASAVSVDLSQPDLGLGQLDLGAIAILFKDERVSALRYAQRRGVPFLSISTTMCEVAPEIATFTQQAKATLVLGGCWLVGLTAIGARLAAASLASVNAIQIGAVLDSDDFWRAGRRARQCTDGGVLRCRLAAPRWCLLANRNRFVHHLQE